MKDETTRFIEAIQAEFKHNATPQEVIYKLVSMGVVDSQSKRNYLIRAEFSKVLRSNGGRVLDAFEQIGLTYGIQGRQVRRIVYKPKK